MKPLPLLLAILLFASVAGNIFLFQQLQKEVLREVEVVKEVPVSPENNNLQLFKEYLTKSQDVSNAFDLVAGTLEQWELLLDAEDPQALQELEQEYTEAYTLATTAAQTYFTFVQQHTEFLKLLDVNSQADELEIQAVLSNFQDYATTLKAESQ